MATGANSPNQTALNVYTETPETELVQALSQNPIYRVQAHATLESLIAAISVDKSAVVIFEAGTSTDIVRALSLIGDESTDTPGIIIGDNLPISAVRSLLLLHRWDIMEFPVSLDALDQAISRVSAIPANASNPATSNKQGKCWVYTSPVGGGGATLLAVETAFQLSQSADKPRICIIDMNFFDGSCAQYLNCEPNLTLTALTTDPQRIDAVLLNALTTRHETGVELLAAPRTADPAEFPSQTAILRVLDVACEIYDHVIVDMPRWPMPWTRDIIEGADETFLISELTVPALNAARDWILDFDSDALTGMTRIKTVLNRKQKTMFGGGVTVEQAEKAIKQRVFGAVHSDWASAIAAVNLGEPVSLAKPNSIIVKDVTALISGLIKPATIVNGKSKKKRAA